MRSLRARLLLAASATLLLFLVLVGVALNRAFVASAASAQQERMQGLIYALLARLEPNPQGDLALSNFSLPDPRLERPQSGLEAALFSDAASLLWGSPSLSDNVTPPGTIEVGEWQFLEEDNRFVLRFGLRYAQVGHPPRRYVLQLIENNVAFHSQLRLYRRTLWIALGAGAVLLLLLQAAVLGWSLRPLRALVQELRKVKANEQETIDGRYPTELEPLREALNEMITAERSRQQRYRNALGDLAHSLKTPLAVLRGISERSADEQHTALGDQVSRMDSIVQHQLKRAATLGRRAFTEAIPLQPIAEKIASALTKVYATRGIEFRVLLSPEFKLKADAGDLYELLGNVMDNAAKYGNTMVRVSGHRLSPTLVRLCIEDNGKGFPENASKLLERGARADTRQEGQGLGLAAVQDIVDAYGGSLELSRSSLGGGSMVLKLQA